MPAAPQTAVQNDRQRRKSQRQDHLNSLRRLSHRQIAPLTTVAQRHPGRGQSLPRFRSELAIVFKVSLYVNEVFLFSLSHVLRRFWAVEGARWSVCVVRMARHRLCSALY